MTQKAAIKRLIGLAAGVITVKTVAAKSLIVGTIGIDWDHMHKKVVAGRLYTMILHVALVGSETGSLEMVASLVKPYWV